MCLMPLLLYWNEEANLTYERAILSGPVYTGPLFELAALIYGK